MTETNPSVRTFFDTKIEFLERCGASKAALLNQELNIFTFGDLIQHYPFRHEDRTVFHRIGDLKEGLKCASARSDVGCANGRSMGEGW